MIFARMAEPIFAAPKLNGLGAVLIYGQFASVAARMESHAVVMIWQIEKSCCAPYAIALS
jgi:hypothetical protein